MQATQTGVFMPAGSPWGVKDAAPSRRILATTTPGGQKEHFFT